MTRSGFAAWKAFGLDGSVSNIPTWLRLISRAPVGVLVAPLAKLSISVAGFSSLQHPELHAVGFEVSLQFVFTFPDLLRRIRTQPGVFLVAGRFGIQREVPHAQVARQIRERKVHRRCIS